MFEIGISAIQNIGLFEKLLGNNKEGLKYFGFLLN